MEANTSVMDDSYSQDDKNEVFMVSLFSWMFSSDPVEDFSLLI